MLSYNEISIDDFIKVAPLPRMKKPKHPRNQHIVNAIENHLLISGEVLEFGVWTGRTINCIAEYLPKDTIFGFDSFEGLPEDWHKKEEHKINRESNKHIKGYFAVENLPKVLPNVTLIKGFFEDSLDTWLINNNIKQIKLMHIDCDLYSSTIFVLNKLNQYIVPGTVIIFDEIYPFIGEETYPLWREGEWKSLLEWMKKYNRKIEIISRTTGLQAAIRVVE